MEDTKNGPGNAPDAYSCHTADGRYLKFLRPKLDPGVCGPAELEFKARLMFLTATLTVTQMATVLATNAEEITWYDNDDDTGD